MPRPRESKLKVANPPTHARGALGLTNSPNTGTNIFWPIRSVP
jgi:hypothetical protein